MKLNLPLILLLLTFSGVNAQQVEFSGSVTAKGIIYSEDESPFWIHSNQRGRVDELTNFSGWVSGLATYKISENAGFELGLGALYQDGYSDELQLDESYLGFQNSWLVAHVGRKQKTELYHGLSATNQNILFSEKWIAYINF